VNGVPRFVIKLNAFSGHFDLRTLITDRAEDCMDTLKSDMKELVVKRQSNASFEAGLELLCSMDFKEHKDTYGGDAAGNYGLYGGSASYSQGNYDHTQSVVCGGRSHEHSSSAAEYLLRKEFPPKLFAVVEKCLDIQAAAFAYHVLPEQTEKRFIVAIKQTLGADFSYREDTFDGLATLVGRAKLAGTPAFYGTDPVTFERSTTNEDIEFTISIKDAR
jgi:hypothetical protein